MTTSRCDGEPETVIRIVAGLVLHSGRTLLVRKRGTQAFMQPGGKVHDAEAPLQTLERELQEELGCGIVAGSERLLGHFQAPAANEPNAKLQAELYSIELSGEAAPLAEIEDLIWLEVHRPPAVALAPFTEHCVLPLARALSGHGSVQ